MTAIGILDTSVGSANMGDQIIMDASLRNLSRWLGEYQFIHFSSHDAFFFNALKRQRRVAVNFLCGTNCLSSRMMLRPGWAVNLLTASWIKPVITLGVGWGGYQPAPDIYTKALLNKLLTRESMLSVRDDYTKEKLESCGFSNVINTGCPTMWGLTREHCREIPTRKAERVVFTFTDYARDEARDIQALAVLARNYAEVHIWPQGAQDIEYYSSLRSRHSFIEADNISLIRPSLSAYDAFLRRGSVDYVGTRLHGGIRALQNRRRTIIIAVDNRATEKRRDFSLPVILRSELDGLESMINGTWPTDIRIPVEAISRFRASVLARLPRPAEWAGVPEDGIDEGFGA